jgi:hypothetical protein
MDVNVRRRGGLKEHTGCRMWFAGVNVWHTDVDLSEYGLGLAVKGINEMEKISLGDIQETLLMPLWGRAVESQKDSPKLMDKEAISIYNRGRARTAGPAGY